MIDVPANLKPHIHVDYPKNNDLIFEEWLYQKYDKSFDADREYLPIFFTSYHVNHKYGQDDVAVFVLQRFIDALPRNKKYWTCVQYDDGCLVDFKDLDILVFGMARRLEEQRIDYFIPLMGKPNNYNLKHSDQIFASFIGNITHDIRKRMFEILSGNSDYCLHTSPHNARQYCFNLSQSLFALCPRGYSATSFRITEALEHGSIPVFISDWFIVPHELNFEDYGVLIKEIDLPRINEILHDIPYTEIERKKENGMQVYKDYYTYESNLGIILNHMKYEQQKGKRNTQVSEAESIG